jgi:hexosaminidase
MSLSRLPYHAAAQPARPALVPQPTKLEVSPGEFQVTGTTRILFDADNPELATIAEYLERIFYRTVGYKLAFEPAAAPPDAKNVFVLTLAGAPAALGDEGYELTVTPDVVRLRAAHTAGVIWGIQTIRQLLSPDAEDPTGKPEGSGVLPCVQITDQPRFRHRGMLLDCGRHFMPKDFVKRYISLLAYHKLNILHWHLTEDQGWRIEIKKYPKLTEIGAWRQVTRDDEQPRDALGRYGGFYTQDDIREIVEYAKFRHITVVPEIEMPGHSLAALASYPELSCTGGPLQVGTEWGVFDDVYCAGNEHTFEFLQDVLSEVLELFPSELIHVGGDEVPKTRWHACPKCQARIKAEGLKDEHELQSYFIRRIEKFLNSKGRRLVGWDEILEGGLAPNATVQSWRGMDGAIAAASSGHDVVSSPTSHCYLDFPQTDSSGKPNWMAVTTLEKIYSFEPVPTELTPEQTRHVLGAEANIWSERTPPDRVDHQVFPRLCALAELTWSPKEARNWDDFAARMQTHYRRLDSQGVTYCLPAPRFAAGATAFSDAIDVTLENPQPGAAIRYTLDGSDPTAQSPVYASPLHLTDTAVVKACTFAPRGNVSDVVKQRFVKLQTHEAVQVGGTQPGLAYAYYEGNWDRLPDFDKLDKSTILASGVAPTFDLSVRKRDDDFALRFTGLIEVPKEGIYTFHVLSDDGSRLLIGSDVIVNHDGVHAATEQSGQAFLKAGKHSITVLFFEAREVERLEVRYEGPGIAKQAIPATALSHPDTRP